MALLAAPAALLVGLAVPATAGAVVYCVPDDMIDASCDAGQGQATVQAALTAAVNTTAVADTVRIGAGNFPITDGVYDDAANAANTVQVIGSGTGSTTLSLGDTMNTHNTLRLNTLAGSTVSNLAITIPANLDANHDNGLVLGGQASGQNILITGPAATNAVGVSMGGTTTLDGSTVNLPFAADTSGVRQNGGSPTITDSSIHAVQGVTHSGMNLTTTIDRSTIQASFSGVSLDSGTVNVRNSVIDLGANAAIGLDATNLNPGTNPKTLNADHVTVVGGAAGSIGFRVFATAPTAAQTSTGTLTNSVISGPARAISRQASNDGTPMMNSVANVTVGYSNYDPSMNIDTNGMNGAGSITIDPAGTQTNFPPGFVGGGNFHLAGGSALLDIGDPNPPAMGALDIDGNARALSMTGTCAGPVPGRRDIGADEFVPGMPGGCNPPPSPSPNPFLPLGPSTPSNQFEIARVLRNTRKGIGFLLIDLPGPGEVGLEGKGLAEIGLASTTARKSLAVAGGEVRLKVKPAKKGKRGRKIRRSLERKGKATVTATVSYVPTGGSPSSQTTKVKLIQE